jgi:DnaJ-class molecular chaperone
MARRDPYSVLGVPRDATTAEIKAVYRQLAKTFHPDVNATADAEERFKQITEAFLVLRDPKQRARLERKPQRRSRARRSRGEVTEIDVGLRVAGIDLGGLVGVHVTVRSRALFDDEGRPPLEAPAGLLPE